MSSTTRIALAATVLAGVAVMGCTTDNDRNAMAERAIRGGNVAFDRETGDFNYLYRYYPDEAVYQSVYNGTWYWNSGTGWRHGALPEDVEVEGHYHLIELPSRKPYTEHFHVSQRYPTTETLRARALAMDLAMGRRSAEDVNAGEGETVFADAPTDDRPQP